MAFNLGSFIRSRFLWGENVRTGNNDFDITKHEFGDTVQHFESDGFELSLYCVDGFRHIELYKDDAIAIAIAKALGVTGEDLK